jgi:hypothetical protein
VFLHQPFWNLLTPYALHHQLMLWRQNPENTRGTWWPWPSSLGRYSIGTLRLVVVPKYKSRNNKLRVRTYVSIGAVWRSIVFDIRHMSGYMRVGLTVFCCVVFPVVCCENPKQTCVVLNGRERERVAHFLVNSNKRITPIGVRNNVECPVLTFTASLNSFEPGHSTIICHGLERFVAFLPTSRYTFASGVTRPLKILKYSSRI